MNLDTFIEIGNQHKECEDYIVSGNDPTPYIILSDGCSTANNTEMGARILCHLAKQYLKYNQDNLESIDYWKLGHWVIHNAEQTARQLGLSISCLTATLIVAFEIEKHIRIMIYGDGSFIEVSPKMTKIHSVEFERNAPYYLAYLIDDQRFKLYDEINPNKYYISKSTENSDEMKFQSAYDSPIEFFVHTDVFPLVLITSDGIDSFLEGTNHFDSMDIIKDCITFKNTKGEFLKRRMNKQMKTFAKNGIGHFDDLSLGAFLKEEE